MDRQNEDAVRLLLAAGARPRALAPDAMEPLSLACELGDAAIVTALLKAGADAREVRHNGTTAFALCAGSTTPDVLTAMRARGAPIEAANVENQTPQMCIRDRRKIGWLDTNKVAYGMRNQPVRSAP